MDTIILDTVEWDLVLDSSGNIAVAADPYALAQDAASAIKTFLGECYWDTAIGVDWLGSILGKRSPAALLKAELEKAAKTVPGVSAARCFLSAVSNRNITGQIQVTSAATGQVSAATFEVINPQGAG